MNASQVEYLFGLYVPKASGKTFDEKGVRDADQQHLVYSHDGVELFTFARHEVNQGEHTSYRPIRVEIDGVVVCDTQHK